MNSYPAELLAQLGPVMFVAGLDSPSTSTPSSSSSSDPQVQTPSIHLDIPQSPTKQPQDAFTLLTLRLRDALLAQRKVAIWQPEKAKSFQVFLVDKGIRFPPRKLDLQDPGTHSPLSPLTPSSPLFPDGLIAPIWIRKHTTLVPSVFVLFLRIFELSARAPLDTPDAQHERDREQEERQRDLELSAEVASRKKSTNERGIKLTVVLMASRRMLDDPSLDARLTFIRRQSGLDSRAALFVLSPVSPSELGDFVRSLQQALYEPAVEYYTNHSKRVRRKRNRHSQAVASYPTPLSPQGGASPARPLRPEGWTVRYEYKMACFAEFRGEDEVALKHYQDAYSMLVTMFGSTAILPPRTKRWAEAKVLADCINVKVSKLYLYNNEHALALSHHNSHIRKFADFSRGWGIGEETFEFWSWMARQHRVLAELLEQGTRSTLKIPNHRPSPTPTASKTLTASASLPRGSSALEAGALGLNPSHALQHPGFYYYMAARCTEMRRERFLAAVEAEPTSRQTTSPGFTNEKKVDHLGIILELYTKSYELFKKYTPEASQNQSQGRLTLWIAFRIAETYYDAENFEMAVRFFERIAKTYRREKWGSMLKPLMSTWYACAKRLGDVELSVRLLVEMLGHGSKGESDRSGTLEEDLLAVLKTTVPLSPGEPLLVDLSDSEPILTTMVVFWKAEVGVGESAAFQLSLTAPTRISIGSLPVTSLAVQFSDDISPVIIRHKLSEAASPFVQMIDLGQIAATEGQREVVDASLRWQPGATTIFSGSISSYVPRLLKISKVLLSIEEGSWKIDIPLDPCSTHRGLAHNARWLRSLDPIRFIPVKRDNFSMAVVRHRPHQVLVSLSHQSPAYLDDDYPIIIDIKNEDDKELDIVLDVLLQPTEIDGAVNSIALGEERSSGLIKGVPFGIVRPGEGVCKTLCLRNTGAAGDRMLDISIQSRSTTTPVDPSSQDDPEATASLDTSEILQTLVVPTVNPINVQFGVGYRRALDPRLGLADLKTFDSHFWDDGEGGEAVVRTTMSIVGPWSLELERVTLLRQDGDHAKVIDCSIENDEDGLFPAEYLPMDEISDICRISLAPEDGHDFAQAPIPGPGLYEVIWRRVLQNGGRGHQSTTRISLPPLKPPSNGLVALMSVPPIAKLHVPISAYLTIRNYHPSLSANVTVQLEPDPSDGFVVAGLRNSRVPVLMPGSEEKLVWRLIPVECGYIRVPRLKVVDRRRVILSSQGIGGPDSEVETEGDVVDVVDVRWDFRKQDGEGGVAAVRASIQSSGVDDEGDGDILVLVLP